MHSRIKPVPTTTRIGQQEPPAVAVSFFSSSSVSPPLLPSPALRPFPFPFLCPPFSCRRLSLLFLRLSSLVLSSHLHDGQEPGDGGGLNRAGLDRLVRPQLQQVVRGQLLARRRALRSGSPLPLPLVLRLDRFPFHSHRRWVRSFRFRGRTASKHITYRVRNPKQRTGR